MAEKLCLDAADVTYVTPATEVASWTHNTLEQHRIQARLLQIGVRVVTAHNLARVAPGEALLDCIYSGARSTLACAALVPVTMRRPVDSLYHALLARGLDNITRIGDCHAPGTIAAAVHDGHRFARAAGETEGEGVPFRRELVALAGRGRRQEGP